jgi:hypothetical protein
MSALIDEFKREHSEIVDALKEVKALGILTKEGQAKLMSVKPSLIEHLSKEDKKLYPVLWKEAEQNRKLKADLDVFAKDWEGVSVFAFGFLDKYKKGLLRARLLRGFETLNFVLLNRMRNEEKFLYDAYDKIVQ